MSQDLSNITLQNDKVIVSLFFIIATLIEFGIVIMLKRTQSLRRGKNAGANNLDEKMQNFEILRFTHSHQKTTTSKWKSKKGIKEGDERRCSITDKIDLASFVAFTFLYIVFNCVYMMQLWN